MSRFIRSGALLGALFLAAALPAAAQVTVQGVVTDESGFALPGVNVAVDGTTQGAVTNLDGFYSFTTTAPAPFEVLFRFVGYRTERRTVAQTSGTAELDVQMGPDVLGLDDVVVTGTGVVEERRRLGTAVSVVDAAPIANSNATDLTAALSGKITGAQIRQTSGSPAGGISVVLRGSSTINSGAEPLYIIDGVIVDNSSNELVGVGNGGVQNRLVDINPNDIERIEVIKGAAAAAVYGSRASNGVVQIFTKRGQNGAPRITYEARTTISAVRETVRQNETPFDWAVPTDPNNTERVAVERFDYQDNIFDEAFGQEHYVSVSGGANTTTYFLSGSFLDNEGIVRNSDFQRGTLRLNLGQQLTDWAFARATVGVSRSRSNDIPSGGQGFLDGAVTSLQFLPNTQSPEPNELGEYPRLGLSGNPLEIVERYQFSQDVTRATTSLNLVLTPLQGLTASLVGGFDTYSQEARGLRPPGSTARPDGLAEYGDQNRTLLNLDATLAYDTQFGADFTSTTTVGGTYQYEEASSLTASANQLALGIETLDGGTLVPGGNGRFQTALAGAFIQETVGLYDRIFLTAAGRVDASSRFAEDDRLQFYPKVSASWNAIENMGSTGLSFLKLRASFGQAGNLTGIGAYERFTNYVPTSFNGRTAVIPSTALGNEFIKPERQSEFEVGTDLSLLAGRLGVELTYYNQVIDDLLLQRTLAPSTGAQTRIENVGELTNRGLELSVRAALIQQRDFDLNATILFSTNRNEVTRLNNGDAFGIGDGNFGAQWAIEGQPLGVFYWFAAARNPDGSLLLDANGLPQRERGRQGPDCSANPFPGCDPNSANDPDTATPLRDPVTGQPTGSNLRIITGDPNPDWNGSFTTDLRYKDFEFRMQWDATQGFDVFNWNNRNADRNGRASSFAYGQELEPGSTIQKGTADANGRLLLTDAYIEDGSFVKLREISLAYTIRPDVIGLQSVRLRLSGRNLLSFDDYSGYDPEVSIAGRSTGVSGFDFGAVPIPRQFAFGATFTF
jgi:TonB-linked SusC/RagA family outer membrane protein